MAGYARVVLDTNVVVSGMLFPGSVPARALLRAQDGMVLVSEATKQELLDVMNRPRFNRYLAREIRQGLVELFLAASTLVDIPSPIRACRDPRDDKFLEVAVHGRADAIISGDADLLALHPFLGIAILTPAGYLDHG